MPVNSFKWKHYAGEIILLNVRVLKIFTELSKFRGNDGRKGNNS
jgi:hypothetical protein